MGARINFVFKDQTDSAVVLYSHWGQTDWQRDIAMALDYSKPRWGDYSYATRMIISYLIKDSILDETGFGIYAMTNINDGDLWDQTVVIDLVNQTVTDIHSVNWQDFIQAYGAKVYAEQTIG